MKKVTASGIQVILGAVLCIEILKNFKSVAHLSQEITSIYPGRRMGNEKSTGVFSQPEDGAKFTSTRHCLVPVPEGVTVAQVEAQLNKYPEGTIQRVTTNNLDDLLTSSDRWAIAQGLLTADDAEAKYETQDSKGNRYSRGELRVNAEGELMDEKLLPEYRRYFYQNVFVEDQDLRTSVPAEIELTEQRAVLTA